MEAFAGPDYRYITISELIIKDQKHWSEFRTLLIQIHVLRSRSSIA